MPLAVTLIASLPPMKVVSPRWHAGKERIPPSLRRLRQTVELDISIMLSFSSSRMTPDAQDLLSILSLLPDGLSDADLVQSNLPIPNILACKSIVLRTSLAYSDSRQRLRVLVPIRNTSEPFTHPRKRSESPSGCTSVKLLILA
ncbi:hypothetical protein K438DRAFT_665037 [Mycena galopus ATCC 62051]|nr:hypothetical protein K438DRAFT_665037 [Mycena galopus ATCC 62051]